ncbi:invasion associated locus B family protein [Zavarzinia aquatilis]|uniref:Invasion associated locus B family protein n=1 Tax=Zavarzinia aquatilis TaxID=2211142 RepID=A0A317ECY8_9PROT|nr:invasion associated locus B family protein [Zavarzinia aquatilis]PWR24136.1 invasion associated locus B family protein [Zavarzinia aquatilis]
MTSMFRSARFGIVPAVLLLALGAMPAGAAETPPDMETQTFGNWTLRCLAQGQPEVPCDIVQAANDRATGRQIMQTSFAYVATEKKYIGQIVLPLGFLLKPGVLIRIDGGADIADWPVTRCEPQGCVVETLLEANALEPFRRHDDATVIVLDQQGKPLAYPLSFKGFAAALDALTARLAATATKTK